LNFNVFGRAFVEIGLEPVEQRRPAIPGVSTPFKALAHPHIWRRQCPQPVRLFERAASAR
jgi:hypothetical protein